MMKVGAHISISGGIDNAPERAKALGAECFQMFSRSPRGGNHKERSGKEIENFLENCRKFGFEIGKDYIIHTPYFINLASENNRIYHGSIGAIREELEFAEKIQAPYIVTHIGSSKDLEGDDIEEKINEKVWQALEKIHMEYSGNALLLLEISAGSGNIIGDTIGEIAYFINRAKEHKTFRLGFCFDTCHAFAGGYDLRDPERARKVFAKIDEKIGLENLKVIHFNDSKVQLGTHIDRHEHIGKGEIGLEGLREVAKLAQELNINLYLETKHDRVMEDIALVKSFRR